MTEELTGSNFLEENSITFESLGIETIFVDEAHNFKNLPLLEERLKYVKGLNTTGSIKCFDMLAK
ncbi:MAG: hypothetical protein SPK70_07440 [Succinivibrio dextrinosolvens]|nr:hypothetical protein [Succinivibrio dextrinosolvens]MDY6470881.1 hypothetical protein [Succinivibrio dextrinosolvens]